jgi:hypothetical protein
VFCPRLRCQIRACNGLTPTNIKVDSKLSDSVWMFLKDKKSMNNQKMHRFLAVYCFILPLLHVSTHTYVSSSGSSSVPAELHANRMKWLIRFCVIRCYVSVVLRPGVNRSVWLRCPTRKFQFARIRQKAST